MIRYRQNHSDFWFRNVMNEMYYFDAYLKILTNIVVRGQEVLCLWLISAIIHMFVEVSFKSQESFSNHIRFFGVVFNTLD